VNKYWYDENQPFGTIPQDVLLSTSGLELARKIVTGDLPAPSMGKALNFKMAEADEGRVVCCVWTMVPVGFFYTTAEFKVNLIRPMTDKTGEVICEGRVVHMGRKLATSEATLKTLDGKLIAHGTETCAILSSKDF